ncbi:PilZ domain-containing protein [Sphingomonas morindae]|uniref:PilZ domain-containing protein n=1 Tax=Sphingomonas morindae TaxID=1541170 RepID=A0ABY4XDE2_9SPHN|nr:PilZ domain-containing protein [Sphingomonas morindae]USI74994.1 PilZ domain-containing protein [Sphingomonas morindae]
MGLRAELTVLDRESRRPVRLRGTIRHGQGPVDMEIHDLSTTGFRAETPAELRVGDHVAVGATAFGRTKAEVIWQQGTIYGFRFDRGISELDVRHARETPNVVIGDFGEAGPAPAGMALPAPLPGEVKLPVGTRLIVIFASTVACWAALGGVGRILYGVLAG